MASRSYVGSAPIRQKDAQNRTTFIATSGQTAFAAVYTPGAVDVYKNGLKLQGPSGTTFTATDGVTVTLTTPATLGDIIEIVSVSAASLYDFYTKDQADARIGVFYGVAAGTPNALSVTTTPLIPALTEGVEVRVRTASANTSNTPTITLSNLGLARSIKGPGGTTLKVGAWTANQEITLRYTTTGGARFELLTPAVLFASDSEILAGAIDNKIISPSGLRNLFINNQILAASGYQKLPGGLILQWASPTMSTTSLAVTWPIAFPNAAVSVVTGNLGDALAFGTSAAPTATGVTFIASSAIGLFNYLALGY
jgi:hypothetical protein